LYGWIMDATIHSCFLVVREVARDALNKNKTDHPWVKYTKKGGRMEFQFDLFYELIEMGIRWDCPTAADLKDIDAQIVSVLFFFVLCHGEKRYLSGFTSASMFKG
jgi:hypothetical protein